jgi:hypothetical protein
LLPLKKASLPSLLNDLHQNQTSRWFWFILLGIHLALGGLLLWFFTQPFAQAHDFARWLSPTHRLNSFTSHIFSLLQPFGWTIGCGLLAVAIGQLAFPRWTQWRLRQVAAWIGDQLHRLPLDAKRLFRDALPPQERRFTLLAIAGIMAAAVLVRCLFLTLPMRHDEAYTVVVFSWRPWLGVISDYHLPNNHIFHSILVKIASTILGTASWAVRFPAFLSGVLCVPVGYVVARQMYGRASALLSAGLIAALPMLIDYSANARGYTLYMLFSLLLFGLAIYLSKHNNLAGWLSFVLFSVLGFYTVPFMVYPFGAACFWLLISAVLGEARSAYGSLLNFVKYLVVGGLVTAAIVVLLYSPIALIGTGLNSLIGNSFIARLSWADFWPTLGDRIKTTWGEWNYDIPPFLQWILAGGSLLSLVFHTRISRLKVPVQVTTFVYIFGILVIQRPDPLTRLWTFLIPLWLIWLCGGLVTPLTHLRHPWSGSAWTVATVCLLVIAGWSIQRVHNYFPAWQPAPGPTELAANYLKQNLVTGDAVAVVSPDDAPMWFYLRQAQLPDSYVNKIDQASHNRVFAVVNAYYGETPKQVVQAHNLSPDEYQVGDAVLVAEFNRLEIYRCLQR